MRTGSYFGAAGVAAVGIAVALALATGAGGAAAAQDSAERVEAPVVAAAEARAEEAGDRLGAQIERMIRAEGPFFTASERATIEQACGYPAGSWDGFSSNMNDGVFLCTNGRRVDSPEIRAVMRAAGPRIGARVAAAMDSPEVREAMAVVTSEATEAALASIDQEAIAREAAAAVEEAMAEVRSEIDEATRENDERRGRRR